MTFIERLQQEKLQSLKGQLSHTIDCLLNRINEMEYWEVKEFMQLHLSYSIEISELENHIKNIL